VVPRRVIIVTDSSSGSSSPSQNVAGHNVTPQETGILRCANGSALLCRISDLFSKSNLSREDTIACLQPVLSTVNFNVPTCFDFALLLLRI